MEPFHPSRSFDRLDHDQIVLWHTGIQWRICPTFTEGRNDCNAAIGEIAARAKHDANCQNLAN